MSGDCSSAEREVMRGERARKREAGVRSTWGRDGGADRRGRTEEVPWRYCGGPERVGQISESSVIPAVACHGGLAGQECTTRGEAGD
jgi:hypothetical protein